MKLKRGQKLCKNCNNTNGARAHTCKHCNHSFKSNTAPTSKNKSGKIKKQRKPKKFEEISNWADLKKGDRIKIIGRSGNYYLGPDGERQYLTDAGVYTVQGVDDLGLHVYDGGYGYIYMGPEVRSETIPNMFRSPHKIVKVNIPVRP